MHITIQKTEAPRFEAFLKQETGLNYPEFRGLFNGSVQKILDLLRDAAGRLEEFCSSSRRRKGRGGNAESLRSAAAALATATQLLREISSSPIQLSENEEERVCRECGGPNGSVARVQIDDVITGFIGNGGRVSASVVGNAYAAWYRVTRELKTLEK